MFQGMGRGLVSDTDLACNELIAECEVIPLSKVDTDKLEDTILASYKFTYAKGRDCIVLGVGSLFNHSETPNVIYRLERIGKRKVMRFYTNQVVSAYTQLFTNYKADSTDNLDMGKYFSK
jgi:hypothetical protein